MGFGTVISVVLSSTLLFVVGAEVAGLRGAVNQTSVSNGVGLYESTLNLSKPESLITELNSQTSSLSIPSERTSTFSLLWPVRAIAYGALPCSPSAPCVKGLPSEDDSQSGYEAQWGSRGRDDLATMKALGANAVRLYHSLGLGIEQQHLQFLDRAAALQLNVFAGVHSDQPALCNHFDCFEYVKQAALAGFRTGFRDGDSWHKAVACIILLNEPDFYDADPLCSPRGPWCRVKAAISALDGLLAAEKEAGVSAGRVRLSVTWSFAMRDSIDGKVSGPGIFGFQDMLVAIDNPSIAQYAPIMPLSDLQHAFHSRWLHGLNTQAPWTFVHEFVSQHYAQFKPLPWFIGEYGANGQTEEVIKSDLLSMDQHARGDESFLGAAVFQFQTAYEKSGTELNFGLFSLGSQLLAQTGPVCDIRSSCNIWPVYCLRKDIPWLPGPMGQRANAVVRAWNSESQTVFSTLPGFC